MRRTGFRLRTLGTAATLLVLAVGAAGRVGATPLASGAPATTTPIKHIVVIFQENVSFDHYFGTYPHAMNPAGEPRFVALATTPSVNGLTGGLLTNNPNQANPQRLGRNEAITCDQNHEYDAEQLAFDGGLMDRFVQETSGSATGGVTGADCKTPLPGHTADQATNKLVMDYYDGNTVTAMWNYAQHFTLLDNSYGTTFGPSTPGALNLVSGDTSGAGEPINSTAVVTTTEGETAAISGTTVSTGTTMLPYVDVRDGVVIGDPDPAYDDCSSKDVVSMAGKNVGNLLNARGVTWGWFQGGFRPTATPNGKAVCGSKHNNIGGASVADYSAHHEPFEYYLSTANPHHLPPSSVGAIGHTDQANHQYDLVDFSAALAANNLPAVSFVKAAKYQDGHPGYSDPLDEQQFIVSLVNTLQRSSAWSSTAVVIAYDDSDGWYDHVAGPIVSQSASLAIDRCGGSATNQHPNRCGYGPRLPMLIISPYARPNYVYHQLADQTSILRFIEDNWHLGTVSTTSFDHLAGGSLNGAFSFKGTAAPRLVLDPLTGQNVH